MSICSLLARTLLLLHCASAALAQSDASNETSTSTADSQDKPPVELPIVDFGYARYRATAFNKTGQYYNFSNIRYAAPPLGNLRWRDPAPPLKESEVNDGTLGYICPQSGPIAFVSPSQNYGPVAPYIPPGISGQAQSEDCLFLDVITPAKLFNQGQHLGKGSKLAPVLVNIHGGGFFIGDKTTIYWPGGLLDRGHNGFVYVSMNYRLSAFGFLTGLEPSSANQTSPNAGLMDQRAALKWVQKNIHLFGGDASQVTLTGQSAGGSSIQYHSIAYGGSKPEENNLFIRANVQSPGTLTEYPKYAKFSANRFLGAAGVSSVDAARRLPTDGLINANLAAQALTPFNVGFFTPTVDGDLIPDIPPRAYNSGKFIRSVAFMASNQMNEGRYLGNQSIATNADFNNWVSVTFPYASSQLRNTIINVLYPPTYDGSHGYTTPQGRSDLAVKEYLISCNTYSIARAYNYQTYNYIFGFPPAIHSQDLAYTYYPTGAVPGFFPNLATTLQSYITGFVLTGNPSHTPGLPDFPVFTNKGHATNFTAGRIEQITSDALNPRCEFWASGDYFPKVGS